MTLLAGIEQCLSAGEIVVPEIVSLIKDCINKYTAQLKNKGFVVPYSIETQFIEFDKVKLIDGGGLKYILSKCVHDVEIENTIFFLLKQYHQHLVKSENPGMDMLEDIFGYLVKEFPDVFVKKYNTYNHRNFFSLSGTFSMHDYSNYKFSTQQPTQEKRGKVFFLMTSFLEKNIWKPYSEVFQYLKNETGFQESSITNYEQEIVAEDEEPREINAEQELLENIDFPSSTDKTDIDPVFDSFGNDSVTDADTINQRFLLSLSRRQAQLFSLIIGSILDDAKKINLLEIFNDNMIESRFNIRQQTFYNEWNSIGQKIKICYKGYSFQEILVFMKKIFVELENGRGF